MKTEALRDDTVSPVAATEDLAGEVSLRPKTLAEYIGQANVRENLDVAIRAARARREPLDHVLLMGPPGTGKTLLTLAAGLLQTLETKLYSEIIITRVTVPVGEDIGFLPGTEEEKMTPWMGALEDNMDVLNKSDEEDGD